MILTEYYRWQRLTEAKTRYDKVASTGEYNLFDSMCINKNKFNIGGSSINLSKRPDRWKGKKTDMAITKREHNLTSVYHPDPNKPYALGDINGTNDGCIIIFNSDFKEAGIIIIEIFIARGLRNDKNPLWDLFIDGELDEELETLRKRSIPKKINGII